MPVEESGQHADPGRRGQPRCDGNADWVRRPVVAQDDKQWVGVSRKIRPRIPKNSFAPTTSWGTAGPQLELVSQGDSWGWRRTATCARMKRRRRPTADRYRDPGQSQDAQHCGHEVALDDSGDHYRLAFDTSRARGAKNTTSFGTKSLGLNVFPPEVAQKESRLVQGPSSSSTACRWTAGT